MLDGPGRDGTAGVTAKPDGDGCAITVTAGGSFSSVPTIVTIDQACAVTADLDAPNAGSAIGSKPPAAMHSNNANRRSGCCEAGSASSAPLALICMALVLRRRRRAIA